MNDIPAIRPMLVLLLIVSSLGAFLALAKRDWAWKMTVWQNRMRGVQSERTRAWDVTRVVNGVFLVLIAAVCLFWILR